MFICVDVQHNYELSKITVDVSVCFCLKVITIAGTLLTSSISSVTGDADIDDPAVFSFHLGDRDYIFKVLIANCCGVFEDIRDYEIYMFYGYFIL